jgi:spermidine synthase
VLPFGTGFISLVFQTLLMRELLGLFSGNELMISIILFLWFILTGAGALAGHRRTDQVVQNKPVTLLIFLLLLPPVLILLMYYLKNVFFLPGLEAGPAGFALFLLIILLPYCFLSGFAFTYAVILGELHGKPAGWIYRMESFGAAAGGLVTTLLILMHAFSFPGAVQSEKKLHPTEKLISTRSGPAGRITVTSSGDQTNIYENGLLVSSTGSTTAIEEAAHFAMVQSPLAESVLVIGGLLSGIHTEILKYPVERIELFEPDPSLVRMAQKLDLQPGPDERLKIVRKLTGAYDVVIMMLPGPGNLSINRFYTSEFFRMVGKAMAPGGIIGVLLPGTANYFSEDAIKTIGPVFASLSVYFTKTKAFSAENTVLLASDKPILMDILGAMEARGVKGQYLIPGYFDEELFKSRSEELTHLLQTGHRENLAMNPRAFFGQIGWWLGQYPVKVLWLIAGIAAFLLIFSLFRGNTANAVMFSLGAGASGLSLTTLLFIQMSTGSFYLFGGLAMAIFMSGLALGSSYKWMPMNRPKPRTWLHAAGFALIPLVLAITANWFGKFGEGAVFKLGFLFLAVFGGAWLTGRIFGILSEKPAGQSIAGRLYGYDLLGSALGALAFPLAILPLAGMQVTLGIVCLTGIVSLILILVMDRSNGGG